MNDWYTKNRVKSFQKSSVSTCHCLIAKLTFWWNYNPIPGLAIFACFRCCILLSESTWWLKTTHSYMRTYCWEFGTSLFRLNNCFCMHSPYTLFWGIICQRESYDKWRAQKPTKHIVSQRKISSSSTPPPPLLCGTVGSRSFRSVRLVCGCGGDGTHCSGTRFLRLVLSVVVWRWTPRRDSWIHSSFCPCTVVCVCDIKIKKVWKQTRKRFRYTFSCFFSTTFCIGYPYILYSVVQQ